MKLVIIGEGTTEYYCVPTIAGRLNNITIRQYQIGGSNAGVDWNILFQRRVVKYVKIAALAAPDKIVVVLDREDRDQCPSELAAQGSSIILAECSHFLGQSTISVIVSNREFESLLFADYQAVDSLKILENPISTSFPEYSDEHNVVGWLHGAFKPGHNYDKVRDGKFLAQHIELEEERVLARSRSLRKLVKELKGPLVCNFMAQ